MAHDNDLIIDDTHDDDYTHFCSHYSNKSVADPDNPGSGVGAGMPIICGERSTISSNGTLGSF